MVGNSKKKWIILPVEVKAREFEAKILLSCYAAGAGYGVIMGEQAAIIKKCKLLKIPKGIFFDKSIAAHKNLFLKNLVNLGYKIACLDEEGLMFRRDSQEGIEYRLSKETHGYTSVIFAWGNEMHKCICNKYPEAAQKMIISGNPRMDLTRPEYRSVFKHKSDEYLNRYKKYILIPSNFGAVINASGKDFIQKQALHMGKINTENEDKLLKEQLNFMKLNFSKFVEAIPKLSKAFPHHKIIIRPHPADDHSFWHNTVSGLPNVKVIYEGNIYPWLLGADAVVHSGCTTGTEAYLLGCSVISYVPFQDSRFDRHLSNKLSVNVTDLNSLINTIKLAIEKKMG